MYTLPSLISLFAAGGLVSEGAAFDDEVVARLPICDPSFGGDCPSHLVLLQDRLSLSPVEQSPGLPELETALQARQRQHPVESLREELSGVGSQQPPSRDSQQLLQMEYEISEKLNDVMSQMAQGNKLLMTEQLETNDTATGDRLSSEASSVQLLARSNTSASIGSATASSWAGLSTDCWIVIGTSLLLLCVLGAWYAAEYLDVPGETRLNRSFSEHAGAGVLLLLILFVSQLYVFARLGLMHSAIAAIQPYIVVFCLALSCLFPVFCVCIMRMQAHFNELQDNFEKQNVHLNALGRMTVAGFGLHEQEDQGVLKKVRQNLGC